MLMVDKLISNCSLCFIALALLSPKRGPVRQIKRVKMGIATIPYKTLSGTIFVAQGGYDSWSSCWHWNKSHSNENWAQHLMIICNILPPKSLECLPCHYLVLVCKEKKINFFFLLHSHWTHQNQV